MPLDLEIVSPERRILSRAVDMVVIPAAEGEMGILPNHAPGIVQLRGGTVRLYQGNNVTDTLFVPGGFAEYTPERCTILATAATQIADLSREAAQTTLTEARAAYDRADKMKPAETEPAMEALQSAEAMVAAAQ